MPRRRLGRPAWWAAAFLALVAYVPALRSSPGRMPADTKLYLYLDPGRLIADAPWTFDARQFAGWVPHQTVAYLWPQGPWYWLGETVGLPDWVTHRLWIGTLFFAAGAGILWAARRLGLGVAAAFAAGAVYQLSPYLLPYVSRTSAMLLPWAGLGWIVGLTVLAAEQTRWRHAALAALVIATVGAVNATALMMVAPAPVLWLAIAAAERRVTWRRAAATAARIGVLALSVSLWWITMLVIQSRHGADVLRFSESLESVSLTSTSAEVWRGLGYWLTYVRDAYAATTTAGTDYMVSGRLIATGFAILLLAIAGLALTAWGQRRYAIALVVTGVVLGVGVHPIEDPSPLMGIVLGDSTSGAALALRSSTRAVPVLLLGLSLGIGVVVEASATVRATSFVSGRAIVAAAVVVLALVNLPVLTGNRLVDPALERDQDPPASWLAAAADLDGAPNGGRVLQLPGAEFGAFRWGYTVDPPLPGLSDRPLVTRDLLPLGSPQAMDLLYALDDRFQAGVAEPASIAPVARLFGVDTVWATGDAAFDRFRTPRPELVHDLFASGVAGLGDPVAYGGSVVNEPDIAIVDEESVSDPRVGRPIPPVELVAVDDPVPIVRAKDDVVIVAGNGDGVIDAAAAGLLDGSELIRYAGSLGPELNTDGPVDQVIVTDTNRARAHHWRGSQDVVGFTEDDDLRSADVLRSDPADERLALFPDPTAATTVAVQEGPVRARASAYGEPFAYRPEDRAAMAIDGDPNTAWRVADRAPAEGEHLRLDVDDPIDHLILQQPAGAARGRHVGTVTIEVDDAAPIAVTLDDRSLGPGGQRIDLAPTLGASKVTITIDSAVVPDPEDIGPALAAVGFAEVDAGLGPTVEVVQPPAVPDVEGVPRSYVFSRLRTRPSDRWRSDPEPTMVRRFEVPRAIESSPEVTVRIDQRASDEVLAGLLGIHGPVATSRLKGVAAAAGWAVTDRDPGTSWITPFSSAIGARLQLTGEAPVTELGLVQPSGDFSPITRLRIISSSDAVDVPVPPADAGGFSRVLLPAAIAGTLTIEITEIEPRVVVDRRYAEPVVLPAAIAELSGTDRVVLPTQLDTGCRDDLVELDGIPLPMRVVAPVAELLAGATVVAEPCESPVVALERGTHLLRGHAGSGLQVDRIALIERDVSPQSTARPTTVVQSQERLSRTVRVEGCPAGCWLVLGEGYNESWSAQLADGTDLGPPQLVDGGFNGWWIAPGEGATTVELRWNAQRPLTIALVLTIGAVLACVVLAVGDRRRGPPPRRTAARWVGLDRLEPRRTCLIAAAAWLVGSVLLIGPEFAAPAAVGAAAIVLVRRPRLAAVAAMATLAIIGMVIVAVVILERPLPNAAWPARFERLHGWGLFAAVALAVSAFGREADRRT